MKKILITIFLILGIVSAFSFNGTLDYIYGYDFSKDASTNYQGLKTNIQLEKQIGYIYFKTSGDLVSLNIGRFPESFDYYLGNYKNSLDLFQNISEPYFLYNINEAFASVYMNYGTLKFGRFIPVSGSSTLYSPSVVLPAHDLVNPFEQNKTIAIDGINYSGFLGNFAYDLTFSPKTNDDIPSAILYPETITTKVNEGVNQKVNLQAEESKEELIATRDSLPDGNPIKIALTGIISTLPASYTLNDSVKTYQNNDNLNLINSNYSAKLSTSIMNFDVKIGYSFDHYKFMVPKIINYEYDETGNATPIAEYYRPYRNVISVDYQGVSYFIDSISYHGEASMIIPENESVEVNIKTHGYDENLTPTVESTSDSIQIFNKYYIKSVLGVEYSHGEDFTLGVEYFNGLPNEELKDNISMGGDIYLKSKLGSIAFEGAGIVAFSDIEDKWEPGYQTKAEISYKGIDNFEPSIKINYAYAENDQHALKTMEKLNTISLNIKAYF